MPKAKLTLTGRKLAYADTATTSNPLKKHFDWQINRTLDVENPKGQPFTVAPGDSITVFSGSRSTSIGSGTEFELTLSPILTNRYRVTWTGAGANPVFRTNRGLTLGSSSVTVTANNNQTATMTGLAGDFGTVLAGDTLFIPGASTGDVAGPFNTLNEGFWTVMSKDVTSATVQLQRPAGVGFSAYGETVNVVTDDQVLAFSPAGVQVGDQVSISAGFSTAAQGTYEVANVTPTWYEFDTTAALPVEETAIPGVSGMSFYSYAVSWLGLEVDQLASVRLNGDTADFNKVKPVLPGDPNFVGHWEAMSPVWQLVVVNKSNATLNLMVFSAE